MSYTPPLSDAQAKKGFQRFLRVYLVSLVGVGIALMAVWRANCSFAALSAVVGLYGSFLGLMPPASSINSGNQHIELLDNPGVKKYFRYALIMQAIPLVLSAGLFVLSLMYDGQ